MMLVAARLDTPKRSAARAVFQRLSKFIATEATDGETKSSSSWEELMLLSPWLSELAISLSATPGVLQPLKAATSLVLPLLFPSRSRCRSWRKSPLQMHCRRSQWIQIRYQHTHGGAAILAVVGGLASPHSWSVHKPPMSEDAFGAGL